MFSLNYRKETTLGGYLKLKNPSFLTGFEAPVGFEPTNKGFADLPLRPLGYSAINMLRWTTNVQDKKQ